LVEVAQSSSGLTPKAKISGFGSGSDHDNGGSVNLAELVLPIGLWTAFLVTCIAAIGVYLMYIFSRWRH
jgi:hypothetical protein